MSVRLITNQKLKSKSNSHTVLFTDVILQFVWFSIFFPFHSKVYLSAYMDVLSLHYYLLFSSQYNIPNSPFFSVNRSFGYIIWNEGHGLKITVCYLCICLLHWSWHSVTAPTVASTLFHKIFISWKNVSNYRVNYKF